MIRLGEVMRLVPTVARDPEAKARVERMAAALEGLDAQHREQVEWTLDLGKWWDRMLHPLSGQNAPAEECVASGTVGLLLVEHVGEIAYWMDRRDRESGGKGLGRDECLDRMDQIDQWTRRNGFAGLPKPVRKMLDEARARHRAAVLVGRQMAGK